MKRFKGFATGFLAASILVSTTFVHADDIAKALEVVTNKVNVVMNGEEVAKVGQNYTLDNGTEVPTTVSYEDTTYVSVRKISEALGKAVDWDSTTKTITIREAAPADVVVSTIGDKKVMLSEVNLYVEMLRGQYEGTYGPDVWSQEVEAGKTVEDMVIENCVNIAYESAIIEIIAAEQGIKLSEEDLKGVDELVNNLKADMVKPEKGITEEILRNALVKDKLRLVVYSNETKDYQVEQEKLDAVVKTNPNYKDMAKNGYAYYADKVRARHILLSTMDEQRQPLSEEKIAEAKKTAEEVLKKLEAGEDFEALVKEYSEDPGSKDKGGEYTFARGQMVSEFEEAAFGLEVGKMSGLVKTAYGYHIIKLEEKVAATEAEIEAVKEQEKSLVDQATEKMKQDYFLVLMGQWKEKYPSTGNQDVVDTIKIK